MAATPVTPVAGTSIIPTGGTSVVAVPPNPNGGYITNPLTNVDQGISPTVAEPLYVSPVGPASQQGNGSTFALQPGQSWTIIPGQTTPTYVNAVTNGHKFSVVYF